MAHRRLWRIGCDLVVAAGIVALPARAQTTINAEEPVVERAATGHSPDCAPMPGTEKLRDQRRADFVIMGEAHGTVELPDAFAGLVCAYAATGDPLTVGLEFLPAEQVSIDAYLASDGGDAAKRILLASPAWSIRDGRASQAILDLVESLRRIKSGHPDLAVILFDHPIDSPGTSAAREKGMAEHLLAAKRARPTAPVLALTSIGHAGKSAWTSFGPPFPAMSQHLPADRTVAMAFDVMGGEIWTCRPTDTAPEECGPRPVTARNAALPRGLSMGNSRTGFDASISIGSVFSASPPARIEP